MKKLTMMTLAALAAALAGCTSTTVETPEWKARIANHWFARDVDKFAVHRQADGGYSISLNGYREDVSEQVPVFTREMWAGLGTVGRLAAAAFSPAAAAVPLTAEAADGESVAKLVKAKADADARLQEAKDALAIAKLNNEAYQRTAAAFVAAGGSLAGATTTCENGSCTISDGSLTCRDGVCEERP